LKYDEWRSADDIVDIEEEPNGSEDGEVSGREQLSPIAKLKAKLDDLLGEHWHVRGLSRAGDFCYVEPGTVRFYFKSPWQKPDYQLAEDGTMKTQYFGFSVPVCQK